MTVLTCVHREGEPGEAAPPGDRLRQPHRRAAVLGKLPEDALRGRRHERVPGGRVRELNTSVLSQNHLNVDVFKQRRASETVLMSCLPSAGF